ncbi:DUF6119 family protein [Spartinivicinus poritis]|uniref:TIGR04141 family sporadically distributed protein n=1 Tax=Spartinivicinus poritis TaxID=2994640 RepID=A0ABT5UAY1_9GAMM|nr:DUF6119 family protein [Spartinivicinus sp. A2-2]MDE1463472.1 TIGR04141 family sporadically distributed protein [Spartinivicinus sp. A2-2]
MEDYKDFLSGCDVFGENKSYFGCLVISKKYSIYAISLGKTHFYLNNFCDIDFGLNLAERILDYNELKIKQSRFLNSNKKKSITSFGSGSEFIYDAGESMHFIKGETVNKEIWGSPVSFGHSIHLKLDKKPVELVSTIEEIERTLNKEPIVSLPKVEAIHDPEIIKKLDFKLYSAMKAELDQKLNINLIITIPKPLAAVYLNSMAI